MNIQSYEVPQANNITSVLRAIENIGNGAATDIQIIQGIPNLTTDRQGRYYRIIGELTGFVSNVHNNATLTPKGLLVHADPVLTNPHFIDGILNLKVIQTILPFMQVRGTVTFQDIENHLSQFIVGLGAVTIHRRVSTIVRWLVDLHLITEVGHGVYTLVNMVSPISHKFEIIDDTIPILPATGGLAEYQTVEQRVSTASNVITIYKDQAKSERANNSHIHLVNLVADRIRQAGGIPKANLFIDLAARVNDVDFIFEMKSTTADNAKSQIRRGISQLYEYRYLQNSPTANLILVVENPLPQEINWMLDYMEVDRNIHLVWDGDNNLHARPETRQRLPFL